MSKHAVSQKLRQKLEASTKPDIVIGDGSQGLGSITIEPGRGLFSPNNPLKRKAEEIFSKEEISEFKKQGEYMYNYDYDQINLDGSGNDDVTQFILMGLRSGLKISSLGDDEVDFMVKTYGPDWPKRFNIE
jgi:hypothetical protein